MAPGRAVDPEMVAPPRIERRDARGEVRYRTGSTSIYGALISMLPDCWGRVGVAIGGDTRKKPLAVCVF